MVQGSTRRELARRLLHQREPARHARTSDAWRSMRGVRGGAQENGVTSTDFVVQTGAYKSGLTTRYEIGSVQLDMPPAAAVPAKSSEDADAGLVMTSQQRTGRARRGMPALPDVSVGGVSIGKSALEAETNRLQSITRRVGKRLSHWLFTNPQGIPGPEFTDIFRYYQASVLNQLREQRERCKQAGGDGMSTEALEAQFRVEVLMALRTFTEQDWAVADKVRAERFGGGAWVPVVEGTSEEQAK